MKLRVKSNGKIVELSTELYNGLTADQKRSYDVVSKVDEPKEPILTIDNTVKESKKASPPPSGNSKKGDKK